MSATVLQLKNVVEKSEKEVLKELAKFFSDRGLTPTEAAEVLVAFADLMEGAYS